MIDYKQFLVNLAREKRDALLHEASEVQNIQKKDDNVETQNCDSQDLNKFSIDDLIK